MHHQGGGASPGRSRLCQSPFHLRFVRQRSRGPEVVAADAVSEVSRLENAIQVLEETNPHAQPWVEARDTVPLVQERIKYRKFTSRRFLMARAVDSIDVGRGSYPCACPSSSGRPGVEKTDQRVEEGKRFVESCADQDSQGASRAWCAGRLSLKEIPPMPTDDQELQGWVSDRN